VTRNKADGRSIDRLPSCRTAHWSSAVGASGDGRGIGKRHEFGTPLRSCWPLWLAAEKLHLTTEGPRRRYFYNVVQNKPLVVQGRLQAVEKIYIVTRISPSTRLVYINKCPTRCSNMQSIFYFTARSLHVSGAGHIHH